jgi:ubiquinone/menaquinone biosynthesis C-methylase UbiE
MGLDFAKQRTLSKGLQQMSFEFRRLAFAAVLLLGVPNLSPAQGIQVPATSYRRLASSSYVPGKVLDIGASSGVFMEEATTIGWDAYGVEPSVEGAAALVQKGLKAKQAFAEQLPYPDNYFDWVHSNHVFEHLADPLAAAKEAFRVLKPGGFIFIEVPNQFDNIQFFRYRLINNIPVRERNIRSIHHLFFFSKMTLRSLMKTSGFRHIQVLDYYGNKRTGLAALGSTIVRAIGKLYLGGPFIQVIARK